MLLAKLAGMRALALLPVKSVHSGSYIKRTLKVSVVGAGGGIGQPLSLLLKLNPLIETLVLHDIANTPGVAADLSHICTKAEVKSFIGDDKLDCALLNSDIVVVPAGMPRKPGMKREDLLESNANIAIKVAKSVSTVCPAAMLVFITNPINTIIPIAAEVLKAAESFDPKRLFGITTLDVVRSKTFIGEILGVNPQAVNIPVIGGHSGITILPVFSQCDPKFKPNEEEHKKLTHRIQEAGTEVIKAKAGKGSATLSMAYAAAHFVNALLRAINGEDGVVECAYVESDVTKAEYFSTPLLLGPMGIKENLGLPQLDDTEEEGLEALLPLLIKNIEDGKKYAKSKNY